MQSIARGLPMRAAVLAQLRVTSLFSSATIGLPWPKKTIGRRLMSSSRGSSAVPDRRDGCGRGAAPVPLVPVAIDEPQVELSLRAFLPAITAARCEFRLEPSLHLQVHVQILLNDFEHGEVVHLR